MCGIANAFRALFSFEQNKTTVNKSLDRCGVKNHPFERLFLQVQRAMIQKSQFAACDFSTILFFPSSLLFLFPNGRVLKVSRKPLKAPLPLFGLARRYRAGKNVRERGGEKICAIFIGSNKKDFFSPPPCIPSVDSTRARAHSVFCSLSERVRFSSKYTQVASVCVYIHGTNDAF